MKTPLCRLLNMQMPSLESKVSIKSRENAALLIVEPMPEANNYLVIVGEEVLLG
jgi:hypothetical protein